MRFFLFLVFSGVASAFMTKYTAINSKQAKFQEFIHDKNKTIILAVGSAGTGKTLLSCQESLNLLHHKKIKKIVVTRPTVSVENEEVGFLPGSLEDKMSPWTRPIYDNLFEFYSPQDIQRFAQENKLEVCPLGFMRGRTFKDCVIIVDEAQNTTPKQMKMVLTRIGHNSKLILNGDLQQSDLDGINGLQDFTNRLERFYEGRRHQMYEDGIGTIFFEDHQIIRHPIIEKVVKVYNMLP